MSHPENAWFALFATPRHEKVVAQLLRQKGYDTFLPLYQSKRRWSDRNKTLSLPLFPGYVFCRFELAYRLPVLRTPGVNRIVGWGRRPAPVDSEEIDRIRRIVDSGLRAEPWSYVRAGQRVSIEAGPLKGIEGIFKQCKAGDRLVVSVSLLQRSIAVEIDRGWAAPILSAAETVSA